MAQIIPVGYVSTTIFFDSEIFTDGEALVTMGNVNPGGGGASDAAVAIADALDESGIRPFLDNLVSISRVECVTDSTSGLATTTIAGTRTTESVPPNCTLLVEKRTPVRGRRAQGRNFWPALLPEAAVDKAGNIGSGALTDLQILMDEIWENLDTAGVSPVILQNEEGISAPISPPPPGDPVRGRPQDQHPAAATAAVTTASPCCVGA